MTDAPDPTAAAALTDLADSLAATLRRDAAALEGEGSPELAHLADQLEHLLARIGPAPDAAGRKALVHVLDEVQRFHARVKAAHAGTKDAISGASTRRLARRAYGEAERYARGGDE